MRLRDDQLTALAACVDEGTFDAAAAALGVTPSAVSQRIKALEHAVGQVVLVRSVPVKPTDVGRVLLRSARRRALVDGELSRDLAAFGGDAGVVDLPVAVNADSLATWFLEVFETVAQWGDARLRVFVEDQDHSAELLRDGAVVGAVTASSVAVQGCTVRELGVMRYVPCVRLSLWQACGEDVARAPAVRFNDRDDLQRRVLRDRGLEAPPVEHVVPSAEGFAAAVAAGLGWGMVPEGMASLDEGVSGGVMRVPGLDVMDVPLYWQSWRLDVRVLARLTDEVTSAAHSLR